MNAKRFAFSLPLLAVFFFGTVLAMAVPSAADAAATGRPTTVPTVACPANVNSFYNQFLGFLSNSFRSRERMIQLTLVGMTVGLFIMLRRMPGRA